MCEKVLGEVWESMLGCGEVRSVGGGLGKCAGVWGSVEGGVGKCIGVWGVRGSVERGVGKCVGV